MLPTERLAYSAITERPRLVLPNHARMAVWVIVNVEEWDPKETMPRTVLTPPAGGWPPVAAGPPWPPVPGPRCPLHVQMHGRL